MRKISAVLVLFIVLIACDDTTIVIEDPQTGETTIEITGQEPTQPEEGLETGAVEQIPEEPPLPAQEEILTGEESDMVLTLREMGDFELLLAALEVSDTMAPLSGQGVTLFAPNDEAFSRLPPETIDALFQDPFLLRSVVTYHISPVPLFANDLPGFGEVQTVQGTPLTVFLDGSTTRVNHATVTQMEIATANGIIHVIDHVLTPVAPPPPPPPDLFEGIEAWQPYAPGEVLPIEDAELVPGAPEMREAVAILGELLAESRVEINTARTVRLEESGEITYLAPIAALDENELANLEELQTVPLPQNEDSLVIGVFVLAGELQGDYDPGPYLLYATGLSQQAPRILLYTANGEPATEFEAVELEEMDAGDIPSAAIFFGTRYCKSWGTNWFTGSQYHVCYPCFFGSFNTFSACAAS